ncbi:MAG: hypothetical protein APF84_09500 [Gracilibacter sp. BRH_c7a]|nr:MAG: hypothetical protein APF84_09500 [Gracilibacter sp. BRH_c7a]
MRNKVQIIYKGPWAYWVGAVVLAILNMIVLIVREMPWGITTNIEAWSVWLGSNMGLLHDEGITFKQLMLSDGTYLNMGVILGAFWGTLAASQARFRHMKNRKFVISALIGGLLMGYGARIASGCNIGLVLNGIASSSLSGWLFTIAVFIGVWLGSKILLRFLL